eukprot:NODE_11699_length_219_cov_1.388235_g10958_i0.p3 GENE.NODE_11699_length_219_cov_1.388235_g10958_i0~~NODE_11699_length_219_cov_1.388235_g10958_i0.p3  ORF type:complete len:50 (-),score=0.40 NODE_11699_length_219_cov_1.388235_g10958_i0:7-156(-)
MDPYRANSSLSLGGGGYARASLKGHSNIVAGPFSISPPPLPTRPDHVAS